MKLNLKLKILLLNMVIFFPLFFAVWYLLDIAFPDFIGPWKAATTGALTGLFVPRLVKDNNTVKVY